MNCRTIEIIMKREKRRLSGTYIQCKQARRHCEVFTWGRMFDATRDTQSQESLLDCRYMSECYSASEQFMKNSVVLRSNGGADNGTTRKVRWDLTFKVPVCARPLPSDASDHAHHAFHLYMTFTFTLHRIHPHFLHRHRQHGVASLRSLRLRL
jgi:hypothetical protein